MKHKVCRRSEKYSIKTTSLLAADDFEKAHKQPYISDAKQDSHDGAYSIKLRCAWCQSETLWAVADKLQVAKLSEHHNCLSCKTQHSNPNLFDTAPTDECIIGMRDSILRLETLTRELEVSLDRLSEKVGYMQERIDYLENRASGQ